ncbi:hypothetical protein NNJEOMEG_04017 [Fundidesulfovibrio magnetotacticus]|uniref:CBS domain-containing protein n=1 Tax=Fundidesulfovibrio magnetotacticus TaxID=2730080 RepID=A0A6V8M2V2_9BACT|nr:CBS domain-containing protein [Fundidesulfovibrio magnetotacticus]GFK96137.1 hypothetical protein NNJEOMEG_04017 [Fundidesulfovibrio magnetotacticus]
MKIASIMNTRIHRIAPEESFEQVLRAMRDMPSRLLHVVDSHGKLLGVISSYDVLKAMLPFYVDANLAKALGDEEAFIRRALEENRALTARELMTSGCAALAEDSHFLEAEALFKEREINALPVLDDQGRSVGEVTRKAVLTRFIDILGAPRRNA